MDRENVFDDLKLWRRHLHQYPEFGFEEKATAHRNPCLLPFGSYSS